MRPLEELRNGNARAQRSLLLNYTSVPPPLVIWRAVKSRDIFLIVLTSTAIAANLLTVALSGLFSQKQIYRSYSTTLEPLYLPSFLETNASDTKAIITNSYNEYDAFYVASANFTNQTSLPLWTSQHYYFLPSQSDTTLANNAGAELIFKTQGFGADLECQEMTTTPSDAMYAIEFSADATLLWLTTSSVVSDGSVVNCTTFAGTLGPDPSKLYSNLTGDPRGRKALEIVEPMQPLSYTNATLTEQAICQGLILRGWVRSNFSFPVEQSHAASNLSTKNLATISSTFMSCRARPKSAMFNVTISPPGQILASSQVSRSTYDLPPGVNLSTALATTSTNLDGLVGQHSSTWHNDTFASDWSNYLIKTLTSSTAFLDARLPPPSFDAASAVLSETYSRAFAIQMSLQSSQLMPVPSQMPSTPAELLVIERRVFMSQTMFYISIIILSLDLTVAVLFYSRTPKPFLPRLPTSAASQIAYFASSHVTDDVRKADGDLLGLESQGYRYGYGKYIGQDGRTHVGIEREPYVTKVTSQRGWNLRRRWWI